MILLESSAEIIRSVCWAVPTVFSYKGDVIFVPTQGKASHIHSTLQEKLAKVQPYVTAECFVDRDFVSVEMAL